MNDKTLATKIIENIGGEKNIISFTHCATRLRFNLKDNKVAKIDELKKLDGVLTAQEQAGQLQVVIGAKVQSIYNAVSEQISIDASVETTESSNEKRNPISAVVETISGIFAPTLPVLVGCGMFKAIVSLLTNLNVMPADSSFITVLSMMGDLMFYFFPFFLAVSAAKKFKTSEYLALALAAGYMYPTIQKGAQAIAEGGPRTMSFLGLPITFIDYKATIIPIILSVWILSLIYKKIDKLVPDFLKIFLTSMIVLFIMIPLQLVILGPAGSYAGDYVASFMDWFYSFGGIFAAALLGGTRSLLTMLGMHYALGPLQIQQIASVGKSTLLVSALTANFAQGGAAFGASLRMKDKAERSAGLSTALSAVLGITEPAMYAVNLKYKRPFVCAMIGSAVAAAFLSLFNAGATAYAPPGLFTMITYTADSFVFIILGVVLSFGLAAVLAFLFGMKGVSSEKMNSAEESASAVSEDILACTTGEVVDISKVKDETFKSGSMGKGVGIIPSQGKVFSPISGTVTMLFPSKHAIGLTSNNGAELLIHIGVDTVNENGNGFESHVQQGDVVTSGDLLITFDVETLSKKYDMTVMEVVTNTSNYSTVTTCPNKSASTEDIAIMLEG